MECFVEALNLLTKNSHMQIEMFKCSCNLFLFDLLWIKQFIKVQQAYCLQKDVLLAEYILMHWSKIPECHQLWIQDPLIWNCNRRLNYANSNAIYAIISAILWFISPLMTEMEVGRILYFQSFTSYFHFSRYKYQDSSKSISSDIGKDQSLQLTRSI